MKDDKEHSGLPVSGYKPQSDAKVSVVNGFKADEERILRKLDAMRDNPEVDGRWLAIGRTQLEQAFMAINRSVFKPGRVELPEDEHASLPDGVTAELRDAVVEDDAWRGGKVLRGRIYNDTRKRFADGTEVTTSVIKAIEPNGQDVFETQNSTYVVTSWAKL